MADRKTSGPALDGLIQRKGAPRPTEAPQRGGNGDADAPSASNNSAATPPTPTSLPQTAEAKTRALTLKLSETQYERLRRFAFDRRLTHQKVIEDALVEYLTRTALGGER